MFGLFPLGVLAGATAADSRRRSRYGTARRYETTRRYGAVPALVVIPGGAAAGGLACWELMAGMGMTAVLAAMTLKVLKDWRLQDEPTTVPEWHPESPVWQAACEAQQLLLASQGYRIGQECAWILSPATQLQRYAQIVHDEVMKTPGMVGEQLRTSATVDLDTAFKHAMIVLQKLLPKAAPGPLRGVGLAVEVVVGMRAIAMEVSGAPIFMNVQADNAAVQFAGELVGCYRGVREQFGHNLARAFGTMVALTGFLIRTSWRLAKAGTLPTAILIGTLADEALAQLRKWNVLPEELDFFWDWLAKVLGVHPAAVAAAVPAAAAAAPAPATPAPVPVEPPALQPAEPAMAIGGGKAIWTAVNRDAVAVDSRGVEFPPGQVPPGTYTIKSRPWGEKRPRLPVVSGELLPGQGYSFVCTAGQCAMQPIQGPTYQGLGPGTDGDTPAAGVPPIEAKTVLTERLRWLDGFKGVSRIPGALTAWFSQDIPPNLAFVPCEVMGWPVAVRLVAPGVRSAR